MPGERLCVGVWASSSPRSTGGHCSRPSSSPTVTVGNWIAGSAAAPVSDKLLPAASAVCSCTLEGAGGRPPPCAPACSDPRRSVRAPSRGLSCRNAERSSTAVAAPRVSALRTALASLPPLPACWLAPERGRSLPGVRCAARPPPIAWLLRWPALPPCARADGLAMCVSIGLTASCTSPSSSRRPPTNGSTAAARLAEAPSSITAWPRALNAKRPG